MSALTASIFAMSSRSFLMSVVPTTWVPLNIMCSNKWDSPVIPGRSLTEPTLATQPAATLGSPFLGIIRNRNPFCKTYSWTPTCCAQATAPNARNADRVRMHLLFINVLCHKYKELLHILACLTHIIRSGLSRRLFHGIGFLRIDFKVSD